MDFQSFKKIPRLSRNCVISEKLDGSNMNVTIIPHKKFLELNDEEFLNTFCIASSLDSYMFVGSRNRWLQVGKNSDNMGCASWCKERSEELFKLGEGTHYAEFYGQGIQRNYGLKEKRMALFNVSRWVNPIINKDSEVCPPDKKECTKCCEVVPILYEGLFDTQAIDCTLAQLAFEGSRAVPNFMNPEGIVIYHLAAGQYFKKTIQNDESPKGK